MQLVSDILPEGRATWEGNETVRESPPPATAALELKNALPPVETRFRDRYFAVVSEGAYGLLEPFLAEHAGLVELAQELADSLDGRAPHLEELGPAADAFRLLLMDFFAKFRAGEEAAALRSFERCGRLLRAFEAKPSILALFSVTSLRTGWHAALQRLVAEDALTVPTKEGLAERLALFGFDPRFPVECVRHNYADQRDLLAKFFGPDGKFVRARNPAY